MHLFQGLQGLPGPSGQAGAPGTAVSTAVIGT